MLSPEPRLIAFDLMGTLALPAHTRSHELENIYRDTFGALTHTKLENPDLYFGIVTNGSHDVATRYVVQKGIQAHFMHEPSNKLLIVSGGSEVIIQERFAIQPRATFMQRLRREIPTPVIDIRDKKEFMSPKPHPSGLTYLMKLCGITSPTNVVLVGDDLRDDGDMAIHAGCHFIHATTEGAGVRYLNLASVISDAMRKLPPNEA